MNIHCLDVLGAPIMIAEKYLLHTWQNILPIANISKRKISYKQSLSRELGMLLPENSSFFSIYKDEEDGMFVKCYNDDILYILHSKWNALKLHIPRNTCVFAIVFEDLTKTLKMGVFDILLHDNRLLLDQNVLERHTLLHQIWKPLPDNNINIIEIHWVGYIEACYNCLNTPHNLPFKCNHILMLKDKIGEEYDLLLRPIQTS